MVRLLADESSFYFFVAVRICVYMNMLMEQGKGLWNHQCRVRRRWDFQ